MNLIYGQAQVTLEMVSCILAYIVIFRVSVEAEPLKRIGSFLFVESVTFLYSLLYSTDGLMRFSDVIGIIIPFFWFSEHRWRWCLIYPVVFTCYSTLQIVFGFGLGAVLDQTPMQITNNPAYALLCEALAVAVLVLCYFLTKRSRITEEEQEPSHGQYIMYMLGAVNIFLIIGITQILCGMEDIPQRAKQLLGFCVAIICVCFFVIVIWNGLINQSRIQYRLRSESYEEFIRQQERQIQTVLNSDEEMRRYRHDMRAHLLAIRAISDCGDGNDALKQYMQEVLSQLEMTRAKQYTGNNAVDAILGNLLESAEREHITVSCNTMLPTELSIPLFDLCIVLSNLIQNAIEACREVMERGQAADMKLAIYPIEDRLFIHIENPTVHEIQEKEHGLVTTKEDKRNHGIGTENIRRVVKKYGGKVEYTCENGIFTAKVCM